MKKKKAEEDKQWWTFTFGNGQRYAGKCVKIWGTSDSARAKMIDIYGLDWGFQYSEDEWQKWSDIAKIKGYEMETEMKRFEA